MKEREEKVYICPECPQWFEVPEDLGPHLERHRPMTAPVFSIRGKPRSVACPKECGRYFIKKGNRDGALPLLLAEHILLCDGSLPLVDEIGSLVSVYDQLPLPWDKAEELCG